MKTLKRPEKPFTTTERSQRLQRLLGAGLQLPEIAALMQCKVHHLLEEIGKKPLLYSYCPPKPAAHNTIDTLNKNLIERIETIEDQIRLIFELLQEEKK